MYHSSDGAQCKALMYWKYFRGQGGHFHKMHNSVNFNNGSMWRPVWGFEVLEIFYGTFFLNAQFCLKNTE